MNQLKFVLLKKREVSQYRKNKSEYKEIPNHKEGKIAWYYEKKKNYEFVNKTNRTLEIPKKYKSKKIKNALKGRKGLPDLIALDDEKENKFVEVKGKELSLSNSQLHWAVNYLKDFPIDVVVVNGFENTIELNCEIGGELEGYVNNEIEKLIDRRNEQFSEVKNLEKDIKKLRKKRGKQEINQEIEKAISTLKRVRSSLND